MPCKADQRSRAVAFAQGTHQRGVGLERAKAGANGFVVEAEMVDQRIVSGDGARFRESGVALRSRFAHLGLGKTAAKQRNEPRLGENDAARRMTRGKRDQAREPDGLAHVLLVALRDQQGSLGDGAAVPFGRAAGMLEALGERHEAGMPSPIRQPQEQLRRRPDAVELAESLGEFGGFACGRSRAVEIARIDAGCCRIDGMPPLAP